MKLNITRPLVVFDLETTGLDIAKDAITQLSYIKVLPNGEEQRGNLLLNPGRPIPPEVTQLTGISNEMVEGQPHFRDVAEQLSEVFSGCDFAGYNSNHFDIPLLAEEFLRAGVNFDFSQCRMIDAQTIFKKMERRNLAAAYQFYCGRKMEDDFEAHQADQDAEATWRVLQAELDYYSPERQTEPERQLKNDVDFLAEFSKPFNDNVDFAGRIIWAPAKDMDGNILLDADGNPLRVETFNFGKHKGEPVAKVLRYDLGFYNWMMQGDFPANTKQVLTRIKMKAAQGHH